MKNKAKETPIVSSAHLVSGGSESNEFEFGLMMASHAFSRWVVRCMAAAGVHDLGALDVLVLHSTNHRKRPKRISDICFVLNIEDTHTVTYALKKLLKLGLVVSERRGKELFFTTTDAGHETCERYRKVRDRCLLSAMELVDAPQEMADLAKLLRALSGIYDQAARSAASL